LKPLDPWRKLSQDEARRVDSKSRHDFFWVVLEAGMPGLMLRLASMPDPLPRLPKLKNLVASFRRTSESAAFVLGLKEQSQAELFVTLCRDVVGAGEAGETSDEALARALQRTRRWHHLLRGGMRSGLSVEEQRGLVGELAFLRQLVSGLSAEAAIEAWTGPTGSAKDFEFIGSCVEVKTRRAAATPYVAISSEDQLADVDGCRLFLNIANVASAVTPEGETLHDHVRKTALLFEAEGGVYDAWEEQLYATGYDPVDEYDGRRWALGASASYEVIDGFPRIASPLPAGVSNVRYAVSLTELEPFMLDADLLDLIRDGMNR
jgi:hypothetical protein